MQLGFELVDRRLYHSNLGIEQLVGRIWCRRSCALAACSTAAFALSIVSASPDSRCGQDIAKVHAKGSQHATIDPAYPTSQPLAATK